MPASLPLRHVRLGVSAGLVMTGLVLNIFGPRLLRPVPRPNPVAARP